MFSFSLQTRWKAFFLISWKIVYIQGFIDIVHRYPKVPFYGEVFSCAMDMTKAFDLVVHSKLLMKLLAASMPAIVVRLMLVMYLTQFANVRWCGAFSGVFSLSEMAVSKGLFFLLLHTVCMSMDDCLRSYRRTSLAAG